MIQIQAKETKYAYHLHYFMQLSTNFTHMDIREIKYPSKLLTNFISYHI